MALLRAYLFFMALYCSQIVSGQGEANYWYFGENAGVNFNTTPPSALLNGQLSTTEGCSVISDPNGNLLFYTDGRTVWNRNHQIMPNANYFGGNGLLGDPSSTSSALVVPKPNDPNLFYVFTVDEPHHNNAPAFPESGPLNIDGTTIPDNLYPDTGLGIPDADDGFNNGFNYSVVDMSLQGGMGDVIPTKKNIHLITYDLANSEHIKYKCSEKITAVKADDCNSFWVITHFIDSFYAFKVDDTGINNTPIVSKVGPTAPISSYRRAALGYLKASPDGKKLAVAHNTFDFDMITISEEGPGGVFLHDFDDLSGRVSNSTTLTGMANPYSVEFSAENKKIYGTVRSGSSEERISEIFQWDLESSDIPNSMTKLSGTTPDNFIGALQLASDNKIYVSIFGQNFLAVINNPDEVAAAVNYSENIANGAISLGNRLANLGLPPFIQSIFSKNIGIIDPENNTLTSLTLCEGETYRLSSNPIITATYTWYLNDEKLPNNQHFIDVDTAGSYQLEIDLNDGSCPQKGIANLTILPLPDIADATLIQCTIPNLPTTYNLNEANIALTKGDSQLVTTFFSSRKDAEESINTLDSNNYTPKTIPEILFAHIENPITKCYDIASLTLDISTTKINDALLETCDDTVGDGFEDFDLNQAVSQLTNGISQNDLKFKFYKSQTDALLETNTLPSTIVTNTIPFEDFIYVRAENNTNGCFGISKIQLTVHPLPDLDKDETIGYCLENPNPVVIDAGNLEEDRAAYNFSWSPSGENTFEISTKAAVVHTVTVTDKKTGCSASRKITIAPSQIATITNTVIEGYSRNTKTTIGVIGIGDYEYAVDNIKGPYQDESVFINLDIGKHEVYVRDKNGCGIAGPKEFPVLGLPEFFTPNGDGKNDEWRVEGLQEIDQQFAKIYIFNRYGKLLKSLSNAVNGWDGTYNGLPLPEDDYWVRVELSNGIVIPSHFSLIR